MSDHSIKSEKYFGEAWKNATPEQKQMVWEALGHDNQSEEDNMRCEAPTKKGTRCQQGGTNETGGIYTCGQEAHLNWAKEELERRMQEFIETQDKEPELKKARKNTNENLSTNDLIMLRRIYRSMERMKYPEKWLNRVQQIAETGTREELQELYLQAKRRNLV